MEKEYFCPSCKKFVRNIRSEFGTKIMPSWISSAGELPVFVCDECDTPVMEFTKTDKKLKTKSKMI